MIHSLKCGLVPHILECGGSLALLAPIFEGSLEGPPLSRLPQYRHIKRLAETVGIAKREQAPALQDQRTVRRPSSPPTSVPFPYRFVFALSLFSSINSTPYRKNRGRGIPLCSLTSHESRPPKPNHSRTLAQSGFCSKTLPSPSSSRTLGIYLFSKCRHADILECITLLQEQTKEPA